MTPKSLLRLMTCGSVDDGKSTLLGRLLYDSNALPEDQLTAAREESQGRPCGPEGFDLSLLLDGLAAEREQGITIDVAYRYFTLRGRRIIVADAPGHEQYTQNMATAASSAHAALVLVDARKGCTVQTRRHLAILSLLRVPHVAIIVNKLDAMGYQQSVFSRLAQEAGELAEVLGIADVLPIPVSAKTGANVVHKSEAMPWHHGPTLQDWLENVPEIAASGGAHFRMPVQLINRADDGFRGIAGPVVSGSISRGARVGISSAKVSGRIERILSSEGDLESAEAGMSVTLTLAEPLDVARGDLLFAPEVPPDICDQFAADVIWFGQEPLLPHRSYLIRIGTTSVLAEITELKHRLDLGRLTKNPAKVLNVNEVGRCNLALAHPVAFEPYERSRDLGAFIVIDRTTFATVGAGVIAHGLRRASNVQWQSFEITPARRAGLMKQQPVILWFTGLSGAGKSTIAGGVERRLHESGRYTFILDGDNVRHRLNRDLGFTAADRVENIRRVAEVARLMAEAGLIVCVSLISPFRNERQMAREVAGDIAFVEVFVDASIETCQQRDPKGLYKKALAGALPNFTGVDSPYESPTDSELHLRTDQDSIEECVERVLAYLGERFQTAESRFAGP